MWHGLQKPR